LKKIIVPQISFEKFNSLAGMDVPLNEKYFRYNRHNVELEKHPKITAVGQECDFFEENKRKILLVTPDQTKFRFLLVLKI
jgi:hypothetical protein